MTEKIMYSLKIEKELLDKAKEESKKSGFATSAFMRQAIIDNVNHRSKLDELEKRIEKLENNSYI